MAAHEHITAEKLETWETLANYLAHGVTQSAAAAAVGMSDAAVTEVKTNPVFVEMLQSKEGLLVAEKISLNTSYDELERKALKNLEKVLRYSMDPDLNVKVAMLANRATRRFGVSDANHVLPGGASNKVLLNMSFNFVKRVNSDAPEILNTLPAIATQKETDFLAPGAVEKVLDFTMGSVAIPTLGDMVGVPAAE